LHYFTEALYSVEVNLGLLGKLPRELRDEIYLDLCGEQGTTMESNKNGFQWKAIPFAGRRSTTEQVRYSALLDLLLVARQFSDEVAVMLYSNRQFQFSCPEDLWHIDHLGGKQRYSITNVLLFLSSNELRSTSWTDCLNPVKLLLHLQGVKTITIITSEANLASSYLRSNVPSRETFRFSEKLSNSKALPALESATINMVSAVSKSDYTRDGIEYGDWYLGKVRDLILGNM
jgi:hypothetical protein